MIIETEINVYDVACRLTRAPEEMAYTLQEFALCDAASLGRDCAEHMTHGPRAEIAAWLRAFADALAPEGAPFDQSWNIVVDRFGSITAAGRELLATEPASAEGAP